MSIVERLRGIRRLFLDTAPIIYFIQCTERYAPPLRYVFDRIDKGTVLAVTSPVTLAECLVFPYRLQQPGLAASFHELIVNGDNTVFVSINEKMADGAASLRAGYNISLADSFQLAVALNAGCDAFLTNDKTLRRVTELKVIILEDFVK